MAKHYVFKTHKSHKGIGYILLVIVAIFVLAILTQNWSKVSESVTDDPAKLTNFLLFMLNIEIILLIILLAFFIVEVKDKFIQE